MLTGVLCANAQDTTAVKKSSVYLDIHAGPAFRLGKADPNQEASLQDYSEKLRTGFQFDVSLYFAVKPESNHMIGFKYNSFNKKAGIRGGVFIDNNGNYVSGETTDNITLTFYGAGYMYANHEDNNSEWSVEGALGYMTYRNRAKVGAEYDAQGSTIGAFLGAAYHFKIVKGVYFGPKISLLVRSINKIQINGPENIEELNLEKPESMSRIDISVGLRFKL
jgi:hypothetical protein